MRLQLAPAHARELAQHYSLRHGWDGAVCLLRRWVLEGAIEHDNARSHPGGGGGGGDGAGRFDDWAWKVLRKHHDDASLASGFAVHTWELDPPPGGQQPCEPPLPRLVRSLSPRAPRTHETMTATATTVTAPLFWLHVTQSDLKLTVDSAPACGCAPPPAVAKDTHFRLRMTGPSSDFSHEICTSGFELFGSSAPQWWSVESHASMPSGLRGAVRAVMLVGTRVHRDQATTVPASSLALAPIEIWLSILGFLRCTDHFKQTNRR